VQTFRKRRAGLSATAGLSCTVHRDDNLSKKIFKNKRINPDTTEETQNLAQYLTIMQSLSRQDTYAVARELHDATAVLFGLKLADNIHYKFKTSQASKARLQSPKHTGAKQNLTQNGHSRSFKVTCFGVSEKVIRDQVIPNNN